MARSPNRLTFGSPGPPEDAEHKSANADCSPSRGKPYPLPLLHRTTQQLVDSRPWRTARRPARQFVDPTELRKPILLDRDDRHYNVQHIPALCSPFVL